MSMLMLEADAISYVRYSCVIWGAGWWAPHGDALLAAALNELEACFTPVLSDVISPPSVSLHSRSLLHMELGWVGLAAVYATSMYSMLHAITGMSWDRLARQVMYARARQIDLLELDGSVTSVHPEYPSERLTHQLWQGGVRREVVDAPATLAMGPTNPPTERYAERLRRVVGFTPAQAVALYMFHDEQQGSRAEPTAGRIFSMT